MWIVDTVRILRNSAAFIAVAIGLIEFLFAWMNAHSVAARCAGPGLPPCPLEINLLFTPLSLGPLLAGAVLFVAPVFRKWTLDPLLSESDPDASKAPWDPFGELSGRGYATEVEAGLDDLDSTLPLNEDPKWKRKVLVSLEEGREIARKEAEYKIAEDMAMGNTEWRDQPQGNAESDEWYQDEYGNWYCWDQWSQQWVQHQ